MTRRRSHRRRRRTVETVVLPHGLGVRGPDFYVFEEDFRQALGWSSELARQDVAELASRLLARSAPPTDAD